MRIAGEDEEKIERGKRKGKEKKWAHVRKE